MCSLFIDLLFNDDNPKYIMINSRYTKLSLYINDKLLHINQSIIVLNEM